MSIPSALTAVPGVTAPVPAELELTLHVTVVSGSFVPITEAVNCSALPALTVWFSELTVTLVTVGTTTLTVVLPDFEGSRTEIAVTKRVGTVSLAAILSSPFGSMAVPAVIAPVPIGLELTFHVTALSGLLFPVTAALNCCVLPIATDCPSGLTMICDTVTTLIGLNSVLSPFGVLAIM